ncbi:MAG: hypothetical protein JNL38_25485 [Myxococcales bacterium]|nr:hypothetical protein [Myxococcales bacterium]
MASPRPPAVLLALALGSAAGCAYVVADEAEPAPAPPGSDAAAAADAPAPPPADSGSSDAIADAGAEADGPPPMKRVFVTEGSFPGDFGGFGPADSICTNEAGVAGLLGGFGAWLSTDDVDANGRFKPGAYYATGGKGPSRAITLPAVGQALDSAIAFTAKGDPVDAIVWTGTLATGIRSGQSCTSWTSRGGPAVVGTTGRTARTTAAWTNNGTASCAETKRFYCFER